MDIPLQVTFRGLAHSPLLQERIREKAHKLHGLYPRITACRVTVEGRHRHHRQGRPFSVRVEAHLPDLELCVGFEENEDVHLALREAFDAVHRQLKDAAGLRVA